MDFLTRYKEQLSGVLHGFDRLIFSGHLTSFFPDKGMYYYLSRKGVRLTGFKTFMAQETQFLRQHIENLASTSNVSITYLNNSKSSKEEVAKKALASHPTKEGLVAIISTQEVAYSFSLIGNKSKKELEVHKQLRKHLHYYCYYMDREFGWMFAKIQSWYPFTMQVYINGKEYLKKSLTQHNIEYQSYNNSITSVDNIDKAQVLADKLIQKKWDRFLNVFAYQLNPHLKEIQSIFNNTGYKWSLHQCEYATDVLFKERIDLEHLYPSLVQHATQFKGGEDIYTFFGRNLHHKSTKEVTGNTKRFTQGFRVKHYLDRNSIKMYDKHTILRIETTINNPRAFKIYKTVQRKGKQTMAWVPMGKAVSNLYRYAQIAKRANLKYLNSLAKVEPSNKLGKKIEQVSCRTETINSNKNIIRFSAFNLLSKSTCLVLEAINDGRFCIQAFSNRQLRSLLIEKGFFEHKNPDKYDLKKYSNKVTRLIAKLRVHGLVRKISHSFKYQVTKLGQEICTKILEFKNFSTSL